MQGWKRIEPTIVTKVGHRTVVTKTFQMPDGAVSEFETYDVEGREYAAAVALTPDGHVIVSRQFRPGPERVMDDLPGGAVEAGESPEQAVRRELLEEVGYQAGNLLYLGANCKDEKFNMVVHYFFATNCQKVADQKLDHDEYIEVILMSIDAFIQSAKQGNVTDAVAVLLAYDQLTAKKETAYVTNH